MPDLVSKREAISVKSLRSINQPLSEEALADRMKLSQNLMELDGNIQICLSSGIHWLECDEKLIAHLCGGKFPEAQYMIYKNVRLCKPGAAEDIAKKEKLTIEQIMFPKNGEMFVSTK